jgi:hypothetical protein
MVKKIYYSLYEAECMAYGYCIDHPDCQIRRKPWGAYDYGILDDRSNADEDDRFVEAVGPWSGEIRAIVILDPAGQIAAMFGYWEDEID